MKANVDFTEVNCDSCGKKVTLKRECVYDDGNLVLILCDDCLNEGETKNAPQ